MFRKRFSAKILVLQTFRGSDEIIKSRRKAKGLSGFKFSLVVAIDLQLMICWFMNSTSSTELL